jgi:hypothetical protein
MAIARLADYPDLMEADYRKVIDLLGYATNPPKGQILHVASITDNNVGRIFDIYESEILFRDFEKNKLFPALNQAGMRSVQSNTYPLHNVQLMDQDLLKSAVSRSAVALLVNVPGFSEKQYDRAVDLVGTMNNPPQGHILHVAGPADGGWRVFDIWTSEHAFQEFRNQRLENALKQVGAGPSRFEFSRIFNLSAPRIDMLSKLGAATLRA